MLRELLASIRKHPQVRHIHGFRIIDAGLTPEQRQTLENEGCVVEDGIWPIDLSARRVKGREFLKACVSRPFIPTLFPNADVYIWLDADTWVQDWGAIELLVAGALKSGLAVVPQVDRAYGKTMRLGWLGAMPFRPRSFYYSNARKAFGGRIARALFPFPTINAGVFAMRADAPHWARWQVLIRQALKRGNIFTAEQLTMGMMIYLEDAAAEFLPSLCNWLCDTKPLYDPAQRRFIEPYLPHLPIGILHLTGYDSMRADKGVVTDIKFPDGSVHPMSLRFPDAA
ncbi:MAG: glycosyl transferase family 8 [Rhodospirillales bacterium]|nr:glycosyl transferase family 8 [Rhodospirillales bacterium]USO08532.1 MAG: glycosyl transferase family 8 [Rhodospirillales bacterium]